MKQKLSASLRDTSYAASAAMVSCSGSMLLRQAADVNRGRADGHDGRVVHRARCAASLRQCRSGERACTQALQQVRREAIERLLDGMGRCAITPKRRGSAVILTFNMKTAKTERFDVARTLPLFVGGEIQRSRAKSHVAAAVRWPKISLNRNQSLSPEPSLMQNRITRGFPAALLVAAVSLHAADKPKSSASVPTSVDPYAEVQPATESLDMTMYQRIRDEGLNHSHVMAFGSALMDGIGPRLTGSPNVKKANEWTRDTLTKIGLENAHLEDWGEFGLGWQQMKTWARMVTPDTAVLIVQATPWSPATPGPVTGDVVYVSIQTEKDFDQYKGKLAGKVVLYGPMREVPPVDKPLFNRYSDKELEDLAAFPLNAGGGLSPEMQARLRERMERMRLIDKVAQFFLDEKVAGVIEPSRDARNGGGSGGTLFDDNGATLGRTPYVAEKRVKVPVVVAAIESYGRLYRLTQAHA